jgi:hypothetical protein
MQKDEQYAKMKLEFQFSETTIQEVEEKMKNLHSDMTRVVDQL